MAKKVKFLLNSSNWISQILFLWIIRLVYLILTLPQLKNLHLSLDSKETAQVTGDKLQERWEYERSKRKEKASLMRALASTFGLVYCSLAIWKLLWIGFIWVGIYFAFKELIKVQQSDQNFNAHYYALGLFLSCFLGSLCFHQLAIQSTRIGIRCRASLMVMVYRKSLKLSYVKGGVGDVVNLISNDCNRIAEACVNGHYLWSAFLECIVIFFLSIVAIGVSSIPANILILVLLLPIQYYLARKASAISYEATALITKRVRLLSEMLTAIKLIKFYAWEEYFLSKLNAARKKEVEKERGELINKIAAFMTVFLAPILAILVTLGTYFSINGVLPEPDVVFSLLALYNTLRYPLLLLPSAERTLTGANISISRLEDYLKLPEIDAPIEIAKNSETDSALVMSIENASFTWDGDLDHPHISNLTLKLNRNQIIAVVGDVGSGKSLFAAILGQLKRTNGDVSLHGKLGYVPQEPWLIDATIKDNIMFGLEADDSKYADTLRLVELTRDLILLSNGDDMFVGDINLSQSQKQRISLARCIIHDPDLLLIEDCFGDFDIACAKRLFKDCIRNNLKKDRCILMMTQQKKFLNECDLVLVMKSGKLVDQGSYAELKARHVNFSAWVTDLHPIEDDPTGVLDRVSEIKLTNMITPSYSPKAKYSNALRPGTHEPFIGVIKSRIKAPSPLATAHVINAEESPTSATSGLQLESSKHLDPNQETIRHLQDLNKESTQSDQIDEVTISKLIEKNQALLLSGTTTRAPANFTNQDIVSRTIESNELTIHSIPLHSVHSITETATYVKLPENPSTFKAYLIYVVEANQKALAWLGLVMFLLLPVIRLISDVWLAIGVQSLMNIDLFLGVYGAFSFVILVGVLFRGYVFSYAVLKKNISLHNRVLKAVLKAPLFFYDSTPLGSILSFFARHLFLIDEFLPEAAIQVLTFGPIVIGTVVLVSCVVPYFWATLPLYGLLTWFVIQTVQYSQEALEKYEASNKSPLFAHLSSSLEGLFSLRLYGVQNRFDSYNITLIDADHKALYSLLLGKGIINSLEVKALLALYLDIIACIFIYIASLFVVLFRVSGSMTGLAIANAIQMILFVQWLVRMFGELHSSMSSVSAVAYFSKSIPKEYVPGEKIIPKKSWPEEGSVEFKNISVRYHQYGIAVLKSVSFSIGNSEKVAIVGRTGSGKTTLLMALLRMVPSIEGEILIDGLDTSTLDLRVLRSRLAIIPQQPVLFSGTIRTNLDPFSLYTDENIWNALKSVYLGEKIQEMPEKLDTPVSENGKMFSLGERQLFCIARAVLTRTKIVVFDEPSVAVDTETDDLIREVITENFQESTVIILANRFRLIVKMDKILVMDHGRVVEYDTPLALLENPKSKFSLMVSQTGDVDLCRLREIAQNSADRSSFKSLDRSQSSARSHDTTHSSLPRSLVDLFVRSPSISTNSSMTSDHQNRINVHSSDIELQDLNQQPTSSNDALLDDQEKVHKVKL